MNIIHSEILTFLKWLAGEGVQYDTSKDALDCHMKSELHNHLLLGEIKAYAVVWAQPYSVLVTYQLHNGDWFKLAQVFGHLDDSGATDSDTLITDFDRAMKGI